MKKVLLSIVILYLAGCTTGHRDAPLNWSPGPSPAFEPKGSTGSTASNLPDFGEQYRIFVSTYPTGGA